MATGLPQSSFECSICFELLLDPVVLSCGHDACKSCLDTWKATQVSTQPLRCPLCRGGALPDNLGVCLRLRDTIEALFPDKVAARRREVAKAAERRKQQQQQARSAASTQQAALRGALRALVDQAAVILAQPRQQQPPPPAAPAAPPAVPAFSVPSLRERYNRVGNSAWQANAAGNAAASGIAAAVSGFGFFSSAGSQGQQAAGGDGFGIRQPNPAAAPPAASNPAAARTGFGFSFATPAGGAGQQAAGGSAPLWGAAPANPVMFNVGSSGNTAPTWGAARRSSNGAAGSSAAPAAGGPLAAALAAAAVALPPAPAAPRQAAVGEAWPLQQVAFTMGWYEQRAPRSRRCRPRGERRQSIRARVRA